MNEFVKLSSKNQVVVPRDTREALKIAAGDEIMFVNRPGIAYVLPRGRSLVDALKGTATGKSRYPKNYLKKERASW